MNYPRIAGFTIDFAPIWVSWSALQFGYFIWNNQLPLPNSETLQILGCFKKRKMCMSVSLKSHKLTQSMSSKL